jgi:hypothetical protein
MDKKEFKKIVKDYLVTSGFTKQDRYYYKENSDAVCSLLLQKSTYSNSYEIHVVIKEINKYLEVPSKPNRYTFYFMDSKKKDSIELDKIHGSSVITSSLEKVISEIINPALEKRQ